MAKQIINISASVRRRLSNLSKDLKVDFNRILLLYTQEKFLFRLKHSKYNDNFVLKGGILFYGIFQQKARSTKDLDFLVDGLENKKSKLEKVVSEIISQKVDDGLDFDKSSLSLEEITKDSEHHGLRIKVTALLDKASVVLQLDIGFDDIAFPKPILF